MLLGWHVIDNRMVWMSGSEVSTLQKAKVKQVRVSCTYAAARVVAAVYVVASLVGWTSALHFSWPIGADALAVNTFLPENVVFSYNQITLRNYCYVKLNVVFSIS